jgi:hypothetical protein
MLKPIITFIFCCSVAHAQEVLRMQNAATLTIQPNAELTIYGDVVLNNGSTLTNNGTIRTRRNGSGTANWTDNTVTPYNHGTGRFIFNSTAVQTIISNNIFERIEMNGAGLSLASNISANKWYLIAGAITTGPFRAIALSNAQLAVEADATNTNFTNSWFNGNLRRYVNPAGVANYLFPVGNASRVNIAEMDDLTATPLAGIAYIDASFGARPGSDAGLAVSENGTSYVSINSGGVWYLTPDATPSSGRYDLKLFFNGFTGLMDNRFAILVRPQASSNAADWQVPPGSVLPPNGSAGRMVADGFARRNDIGNFGQFGIGELFAALPVTLANFDAVRLSRLKVKLEWQTSTETNNKGFEIERRLENESSFTTLGFTASKAADGNSTLKLDYAMVDPNGYGGVSYYRLKQIDKDGRAFHSLIKAVKGMGQTSVSILLWPNPARGQFSIRLDGATGIKDAFITDASGKTLRRLKLSNNQQINIQGLPAGAYVITVLNAFGEGDDFREKVVVIK